MYVYFITLICVIFNSGLCAVQDGSYVENQDDGDIAYPENNNWKPVLFEDKAKPVKEKDLKSDDKLVFLRPYQPPPFIYGLNTYPYYVYGGGIPAHLNMPIYSYPDINYFVKKIDKDKQ